MSAHPSRNLRTSKPRGHLLYAAPFPGQPPIVNVMFELLYDSDLTIRQTAAKAGVDYSAIYRWALGHVPLLSRFTEVLDALGYELRIHRKDQP